MAAAEKPRKNDESCSQNGDDVLRDCDETSDDGKPISRTLSASNLLSVTPVPAKTTVYRLVVVSSKIRQPAALKTAALEGVILLIYEHDGENLDTLLDQIKTASSPKKPVSMAFLAHGHPGSMVLCSGQGEKVMYRC